MPSPTTSVQLIVFGSKQSSDFGGVLSEVTAAGFPAIEAGNLFVSHGEETTRRLLEQYHVGISGAHFGYGEFTDPDKLKSHIAYMTAIGCRNLMCSGVAGNSLEGFKQSAKLFNEIGKITSDAGITFNYHNHDWEFRELEAGVNGMTVLASETDPAFVKFNMDVFWLYYAGQDPAAFINAHPERAGYFHFKDGRRFQGEDGKTHPEFLELGRGDVDLKAAFAAAISAGAEWIVAEQDSTKLTSLESVTISRAYLKDSLGV